MSGQLSRLAEYSVLQNRPSLLYNNLHALSNNKLLYISNGTVVRSDSDKKSFSNIACYPESVIYCFATFVEEYGDVVAIVNPRSVDIFLSNKKYASLIYEKSMFGKGIGIAKCATLCLNRRGTMSLFVGTETGELISSDFDLSIIGHDLLNLSLDNCVNAHKVRSITALDATYNQPMNRACIISGDGGGNIALWDKNKQPYLFMPSCDVNSECVTAAKLCGGKFCAVSFGNGKLIIYNTTSGYKRVEICAHAAWITAMVCYHAPSFEKNRSIIATASEDRTVQLYKVMNLNEEVAVTVEWLGSAELENVLPTGVCFEEDGKKLFISCYDTPSIFLYTLSHS